MIKEESNGPRERDGDSKKYGVWIGNVLVRG